MGILGDGRIDLYTTYTEIQTRDYTYKYTTNRRPYDEAEKARKILGWRIRQAGGEVVESELRPSGMFDYRAVVVSSYEKLFL